MKRADIILTIALTFAVTLAVMKGVRTASQRNLPRNHGHYMSVDDARDETHLQFVIGLETPDKNRSLTIWKVAGDRPPEKIYTQSLRANIVWLESSFSQKEAALTIRTTNGGERIPIDSGAPLLRVWASGNFRFDDRALALVLVDPRNVPPKMPGDFHSILDFDHQDTIERFAARAREKNYICYALELTVQRDLEKGSWW
jgi:hypothetical protein